jgi:hypothetical protein
METIKTYIDNVFKAYESNEKAATLKRDMLAGMEEKYQSLKNSGKSEHEAVGSVIADFGNIDEIVAELEIADLPQSQSQSQTQPQSQPIKTHPLTREEAFDFIEQFKKSALWIAVGVWLVLTGVAAMLLIAGTTEIVIGIGVGGDIHEVVGLIVMLVFIAGAVPLFIIHGMALSRFEFLEFANIELDTSTRAELQQVRKAYVPKFAASMAIGVAIVLLGVGMFLLTTVALDAQAGAVALLVFLIGFSTIFFIRGGMQFGAYEILLQEGEHSYRFKRAAQENERLIGTVAAVFWPTVTAVYLLWSFISEAWDKTWLVWPIAGILFGAFAGGVSVWNEGKK